MLRIFWSCCSRLTLMSMLWMMTCARHCFTPLSQTICMLLAFFLTTVFKDTGTISLGYLLRNCTPFYCQLYLFYDVINYLCVSCKKYDWRDQHLCKFIGTKESVYIRKESNSHRTSLGHQHGRRDVMCKRCIMCRPQPHAWSFRLSRVSLDRLRKKRGYTWSMNKTKHLYCRAPFDTNQRLIGLPCLSEVDFHFDFIVAVFCNLKMPFHSTAIFYSLCCIMDLNYKYKNWGHFNP